MLVSVHSAAADEIRLKPEARVPAGPIALGAVAEIKSDDPERAERLGRLEVGMTPTSGTPFWLRATELQRAVERLLGEVERRPSGSTLRWTGAPVVRIEIGPTTSTDGASSGAAISSRGWPRILEAMVRERTLADGFAAGAKAELEVRADGLLTHLERRPARRIELEPPAVWKLGVNRVRFVVPDESGERLFPAEVIIIAAAQAVVPTRDLRRGEILSDADLRPVRHESRQPRRDLVADLTQVVGKRVERPLKVGEPLTPDDVRSVPVVFRGEPVTVRVTKGALTLMELPGKALADAAIGDWVEVANASTNRPMLTKARVVESGVVELGDGAPPSKLANDRSATPSGQNSRRETRRP
jgi:flagella basal body P-ring formation protein FlgA